jgi:DNA-binding response OmpR family regulator
MITKSETENSAPLAGLRVLVVEDDYFIADEICTTLRNGGAEVLGPSPDIEHGLDMVKRERLDCAVLDINLHGDLAFSLAAELRRQGTPSIFATGYDQSVLPGTFSDSVRLEKPVNLNELLRAVQSVCARTDTRPTGTEH